MELALQGLVRKGGEVGGWRWGLRLSGSHSPCLAGGQLSVSAGSGQASCKVSAEQRSALFIPDLGGKAGAEARVISGPALGEGRFRWRQLAAAGRVCV